MAVSTLQKITTKAKQLRKAAPKMKWTDAIKKAAKELKGAFAPAKKAKVAGVVRTKRKRTTAPVKVPTKISASPKKKADSLLRQGNAIVAKIAQMEAKYKTLKNKEAKQLMAMAINGEHFKLDIVKQQLKNKY